MGIVLDSSVLIAAERRRFDFPRFLSRHSNELFFITSITLPNCFTVASVRLIPVSASGANALSKT